MPKQMQKRVAALQEKVDRILVDEDRQYLHDLFVKVDQLAAAGMDSVPERGSVAEVFRKAAEKATGKTWRHIEENAEINILESATNDPDFSKCAGIVDELAFLHRLAVLLDVDVGENVGEIDEVMADEGVWGVVEATPALTQAVAIAMSTVSRVRDLDRDASDIIQALAPHLAQCLYKHLRV